MENNIVCNLIELYCMCHFVILFNSLNVYI